MQSTGQRERERENSGSVSQTIGRPWEQSPYRRLVCPRRSWSVVRVTSRECRISFYGDMEWMMWLTYLLARWQWRYTRLLRRAVWCVVILNVRSVHAPDAVRCVALQCFAAPQRNTPHPVWKKLYARFPALRIFTHRFVVQVLQLIWCLCLCVDVLMLNGITSDLDISYGDSPVSTRMYISFVGHRLHITKPDWKMFIFGWKLGIS